MKKKRQHRNKKDHKHLLAIIGESNGQPRKNGQILSKV